MKVKLSPGVVASGFDLIELVIRNLVPHAKLCQIFPEIGVVESQYSYQFAQYVGWIEEDDSGNSVVTETGKKILEQNSVTERLQTAILQFVMIDNPPWVKHAIFGRHRMTAYAPPEVRQILDEAELLDELSDQVVMFWDKLAAIAREERNEVLMNYGRLGERMSLEFEQRRTCKEPLWMAVEDSTLGYDILSVTSTNSETLLTIEVKAGHTIGSGEFHISKNEWEFALLAHNHKFHIWDISKSPSQIAVLNVEQLSNHIAANVGEGEWESIVIPFSVFESEFKN